MKKLKMLCVLSVLALVMAACSNDSESVSKEDAEAIDVSSYFPPVGMKRTYIQYGTEGETMESADTVNLSENTDGPDTVFIHERGGIAAESIKEYDVSDQEVKLIYVVNAAKNEETSIVELANKPKWDKNDADHSVSRMTKIGMTLEVPAATYEDVIEVTTEIPDDKKGRRTIHYYAPGVGLIKTVFVFGDGDEFTFSELKSVEMTADAAEEEEAGDDDAAGSAAEEQKPAAEKDEPGSEPAAEADEQDGVYSNSEYGFSFEMPEAMLDKLKVDTGTWDQEALATVDFTLTDEARNIEQSLFSILVFKNDGNASSWEHPVYKYVGSNDQYVFAYTMSSDPSEEMLQPENEDLLKEAQVIIEESKHAMETFDAE